MASLPESVSSAHVERLAKFLLDNIAVMMMERGERRPLFSPTWRSMPTGGREPDPA